jgi:hypothetical protein
MVAKGDISTYISSSKKDIVNHNDNFSFNVLPFYFEWKGKSGEINQIKIINDGVRHNNEESTGKNYQKYLQYAPDVIQTDAWSEGQINIGFSEPVAKAEIIGKTLIIDGNHWVSSSNHLFLDKFELEWIEDRKVSGNNQLILKIKERGIINNTSYFSPKIAYLLINFGNSRAKMDEYKSNLQVGKKYHFNGDRLENTKILTNKQLDINNSADNIPEIREYKGPEIITHGHPISHSELTINKVNKLKELFQKNNIKKVVFQKGGLFIEYNNNNNNNFVGKNEAEFSQWKDFNREYNQKEISWETLNNYNSNPNHNNNLPTILTVGAILVLAGVLITYFLTRKKQKINNEQ